MSIHDRVSDWQLTHIAQVGGASTVGAGVYFFQLRSEEANVNKAFAFGGAGLGLGGSMGGGTLDGSPCEMLECISFSALDLHGCYGLVAGGGIGLAVGAGAAVFTALRTRPDGQEEVLFLAAEAGGAAGVALGGSSLIGRWCMINQFLDDYVAAPMTAAGRYLQELVN